MQTNRAAARTLTMPTTTYAAPQQPPAQGVPPQVSSPLQVKDGFEAGPATAKAGVKTDALLGPALKTDDKELLRLKQNLVDAQKTGGDVKGAYKALAAYVYGVPAEKINVITGWSESSASKINVLIPNRENKAGSVSGWTVPEGKSDGAPFEAGRDVKPTVIVNAKLLEQKEPARAQKVLFHEGQHLAHAKLAADAYDRFKTSGKKGETFEAWVNRQKNLSPTEKVLIKEEHAGGKSNTEAVAHTEAFIASFQKLAHHGTKSERIANEGAELLDLADQRPDPAVAKQERANLKKFYDSLGPADQKALRDTLKDLPANWLTSAEPIAGLLKQK